MLLIASILEWFIKSLKNTSIHFETISGFLIRILFKAIQYWPYVVLWLFVTIFVAMIIYYVGHQLRREDNYSDKASSISAFAIPPVIFFALSIFLGIYLLSHQEDDYTLVKAESSLQQNANPVNSYAASLATVRENRRSINYRERLLEKMGLQEAKNFDELSKKELENRQLYIRSCFQSIVQNSDKSYLYFASPLMFEKQLNVSVFDVEDYLNLDVPLKRHSLSQIESNFLHRTIMNRRVLTFCRFVDAVLLSSIRKKG